LSRQEFGDWQTPLDLAQAALARVAKLGGPVPAVVVEPTCGEGSFLVAAAGEYERARLLGYEIKEPYVNAARAQLPPSRAHVALTDFFAVDWEHELAALPGPILVTGNPPWVTNASLGVLGSKNLPAKSNFKGQTGYDAMTGKSNFDVSEWMILRLLGALQDRRATFAVLCKTAVARRVVEFAAAKGWNVRPGGLWRIEARRHFHAAVDAVLFVCETGKAGRHEGGWPIYESLDAASPTSTMDVVDGVLVADAEGLTRTAHLAGNSDPEWRSGLKHDCSRVMELERVNGEWINGLGEHVTIEEEYVFPLLKSSDVANGATGLTKYGKAKASRFVVVTQRKIGEETATLRQRAPRVWEYLSAHREQLAARKSSIYRGQPDFAIFGVGPYSFAPWKVAVSGLYKSCAFTVIAPQSGRPAMLDDTCYFLPFDSEIGARNAWAALTSSVARDFLAARIFLDAKRPVSKAVLQKLDLQALLFELKIEPVQKKRARQELLRFPRTSPRAEGWTP
jgi:hypothetical protein